MNKFLPVFPLQLVVFPGELLNLHLFEPRYKELANECEEKGTTFGIPPFINKKIMDFGTEIELLKIEKRYPNGELDIKTRGLSIYKTNEYFINVKGKMYSGSDVEILQTHPLGDILMSEQILEYLAKLFQILKIKKPLPNDLATFSTFQIAHHAGLSIEQEYELLCLPDEIKRQQYMVNHLKNLIPIVKEMEELRKKAQMNGHFKNVIPPKGT